MERNVAMTGTSATQTVGFSMSEADRRELDELAAYFTDGNRSAYLRATFKIMRSVKLAEEMREFQAYGQQKSDELGVSGEDARRLIREAYKRRPA